MQGQACAIQEDQVTRDQEHGITQKTRDLLAERKSGIKIVTWEKLWEVLFPDVPCPSSGMSRKSNIKIKGSYD